MSNLIQEYEEGESLTALAQLYGVARKTVYRWLGRYDAAGVAGLADRSGVPKQFLGRVSEEMVALIVAARHRWHLGAAQVAGEASGRASYVGAAGAKHDRRGVEAGRGHYARKARVKTAPYAQPFAAVEDANQTWCADYKGHFRTADGTRCDPLTITDAHSRYLLRCHITPKCDGAHVAAVFDACFREHGLPQ